MQEVELPGDVELCASSFLGGVNDTLIRQRITPVSSPA
jgi:hypothetical protein